MFACHRRPDRSFFWQGKPFPVCARCTGLYLGYGSGIVLALFFWSWVSYAAILLLIPLIVDSLTQSWQWRTSTNPLRFITGLLGGIGIIGFTLALAYSAAVYLQSYFSSTSY
ncbi:DUF2085 domain-containing protein [Siphonobacter sp. SORGH_AS_1065]|uniref:DUF2085 domain-containing protein n=1 Tax=Siphonobacter sp. SORGH_AS_1065 TaxID=3041795 RepID=UPI00278122AB|nr:DUF2085 domain-containing protein [Siphonobacter sp. SORGH_AS_1065]MDQ1087090.1 putative membrane protein [Siphonobacter sp. SORGH_AS_1065]